MKHWAVLKRMEHFLTGERGLRLERLVGSLAAIVVLVGMLVKIVAAWPHRVVQAPSVAAPPVAATPVAATPAAVPPAADNDPFVRWSPPLSGHIVVDDAPGCDALKTLERETEYMREQDTTAALTVLIENGCSMFPRGQRVYLLARYGDAAFHALHIRPRGDVRVYWTLASAVQWDPAPAAPDEDPILVLSRRRQGLPAPAHVVHRMWGCVDLGTFTRTWAADTAQTVQLVGPELARGTCTLLPAGTPVEIVATRPGEALIKIRLPGEGTEYWTVGAALHLDP